MNSAEAHERLMENQEFWEMFFPLFRDEARRFDYLHKKFAPHLHEGNGTIN